jgi:uncharacterized membrane-anchored protein YjiN (DUF445 family)
MNFAERTGLNRFNPAQGGARGMRVMAGGLLVLMAALFLFARMQEPYHPGWGFVRAFAEAAMVGGLADWFAVTALFRHPLGLPIPHTAIIPRNKDRIGDSLASFLQNNFLTPSVVSERLESVDIAGALGRWLRGPSVGDGRLRRSLATLTSDVLGALDNQAIAGLVKGAASSRLRALEVSPLIGAALGQMIDARRHVPMLDAFVAWAARLLAANEPVIREMVHDRAGWFMRFAGLDEKIADKIIDGLAKLFDEMASDPEHPVRARAEEMMARLSADLQTDPATRARVEKIKLEVIDNPAVGDWLEGLWDTARAGLLKAIQSPAPAVGGGFTEALRGLGASLENDERLNGAVNDYACRAVVGAVTGYGGSIVTLVSDTIRGWDAHTVTDRLEAAVGRDLQYIRINGTLVGGLVGLAIHSVTVLL